jgi:DNA-binding winged helix-turn-helix (wHTH) protein
VDEVVPRVLQFDRFVLDLARGCLHLDDRELELRPKAFKVLCHLAERAGHLVAKEELHKAVWNDIAVSDDSLVQCIRQLRDALGDEQHRLIKTVARRGYLLDVQVSRHASGPGTPAPLRRSLFRTSPRSPSCRLTPCPAIPKRRTSQTA